MKGALESPAPPLRSPPTLLTDAQWASRYIWAMKELGPIFFCGQWQELFYIKLLYHSGHFPTTGPDLDLWASTQNNCVFHVPQLFKRLKSWHVLPGRFAPVPSTAYYVLDSRQLSLQIIEYSHECRVNSEGSLIITKKQQDHHAPLVKNNASVQPTLCFHLGEWTEEARQWFMAGKWQRVSTDLFSLILKYHLCVF